MESKLVEINDTIIKAKQDASNLEDNVNSLWGTVNSNADRLLDLRKKYASDSGAERRPKRRA
jgi:hypothetical protein